MNIVLFLNDIGTSEVVFILAAVLMLFGAKSIPSLAKNLGRGMREIKTASDDIKRDIQKSANDMKRDMNMPNLNTLNDSNKLMDKINNPVKEIGKSISEAAKKVEEYDSNPNKA
jgi:sec-independent protein translocase protein TatA